MLTDAQFFRKFGASGDFARRHQKDEPMRVAFKLRWFGLVLRFRLKT